MKYIEDTKRSKVRLYVLKDKSGDIIDVRQEDLRRNQEFLDGKQIYNTWGLPPQDKARVTRIQKTLTKDCGHEEVHPFAFEAEFYVSGSGSSSRYTDVLYLQEFGVKLHDKLIDDLVILSGYGGNMHIKERRKEFESQKVGITVGNFNHTLSLAADSSNRDFKLEVKRNMIRDGKEVVVLSGNWAFETNKNSLCIKPYVKD